MGCIDLHLGLLFYRVMSPVCRFCALSVASDLAFTCFIEIRERTS